MRHRTLLISSLLIISSQIHAGEPMPPKNDAPLDASFLRLYAETRGFMLGRPVKPKPTPDGKAVLFLRSEAKKPKLSLYEFDVATGKTRELLTPESLLKGAEENLSAEEKARRERQRISLGGFTDYQLNEDGTKILLSLSGKLYVVDRTAARGVANLPATELKTGPGTLLDPKFSPSGAYVSYVLNEDVFVYDLATNKETQVTKGGTDKKTHGLAEFVAQEEMARFSGYWWSPDSKFLAYEEADHEGVETWYVADAAKPDQKPLEQYYPRPGKKNVSVRLGIIPITGGETVWVDWGHKKYEYLAAVRWDKQGPLTIQVQDRKQQELALLLVDPKTGKTSKLLEEKDAAFINLYQDVPRWLPGGKQFVWMTERSGKLDAELVTPATSGEPERVSMMLPNSQFKRIVGIDKEGTRFIAEYLADLEATTPNAKDEGRALNTYVGMNYFKEIRQTGPRGLTPIKGESAIATNDSFSVDVMTHTSPKQLPQASVQSRDEYGIAKKLGDLPSVAIEPDTNINITMQFLPGAGQGFYAAIIRPHGFDASKKYPVILDVYGGPHHLTVSQAMRPWLLMQWLADQGFIVVAVDNRGTPGRGRDWERSIYQKFDSVPLEDQVAGLQLLGKQYSYMDMDRVGIVGWSFGGYMSALAVLKRPDVFKAAVAGAPVTDWEDYDTHYTERYMGLLPESQKAYDDANLVKMADKLTRPLLLVHGTADDNVYFRHTLKLTDALFRAGKEFEVLPLPSLTHMVPDPVVTERLWGRVAGHFQKHLGKAK